MLDIHELEVGFDDTRVLAGAGLSLPEGRKLLICGAAGSGKSTLLNVAAGIIPRLTRPKLFAGEVSLKSRPMAAFGKDELFSTVSIIGQAVEDQLWDLNVEDLIAFPLENRGFAKDALRERLQALLTGLELDALRGRRVLTLSGGERRMVAIAAGLAVRPALLVLDEPTTGLDPAARRRLTRMLASPATGIPSLLVAEQDPASMREVIDSVALLRDGALSAAEPSEGLMAQQAPWLAAGILPPLRRAVPRRTASIGQQLLGVQSLRTRLSRGDGRPVLEDIGFEIRAGEVVALIGRNGAGKTTLFQSILGLAKISGGTITLAGENTQGWTVARRARSIAYLPQNMRRVLFNMTLLEEVMFAMTSGTGSTGNGDLPGKAMAALTKYGLEALAEANPFALSARQQALLGLAWADAAEASITILDEPLLARDVYGRRMLDLFIETMLAAGRSVMLISHDLELVDDAASRLLILDEGRIAYDGAPDQAWRSGAFHALGWPVPYAPVAGEAA